MQVFVVSAGRPQAVETMQGLLRPHMVNWMVRPEDYQAYADADADAVYAQEGKGVCAARNSILTGPGKGHTHFQLSDDLKGIKRLKDGKAVEMRVPAALNEMADYLDWTDFRLCGVAPTNNPFYGKEHATTSTFILGDLMLIKPSGLLFDERLPLKEDYDYTCQHYKAFGGSLRLDWLLPTFTHRTNAGGAVAYRTAQVEQQAISILKSKWGRWIVDNPRRENEVLLKLPRPKREAIS